MLPLVDEPALVSPNRHVFHRSVGVLHHFVANHASVEVGSNSTENVRIEAWPQSQMEEELAFDQLEESEADLGTVRAARSFEICVAYSFQTVDGDDVYFKVHTLYIN